MKKNISHTKDKEDRKRGFDVIGSSEERTESSLKISICSHKTFFGILVRDLRLCSPVAQTVKCLPTMRETWV